MDDLLYALVGVGLAVGLSFLAELPKRKTWLTWLARTIGLAAVSGAIGFVTQTTHQTAQLARSIERRGRDAGSRYAAAQDWADHLEGGPLRGIVERELRLLNERLDAIPRGDVYVDRERVIDVWKTLFTAHGRHQVRATNLVSKEEWDFFGRGGAGTGTHRSAMGQGVSIERIMIFDEARTGHREGLEELGRKQKEDGVKVLEVSKRKLDHPSCVGWLRILGPPDIVLFDKEYLLITETDQDYAIRRSVLTTDPARIAAADEFWSRLREEAAEIPENK